MNGPQRAGAGLGALLAGLALAGLLLPAAASAVSGAPPASSSGVTSGEVPIASVNPSSDGGCGLLKTIVNTVNPLSSCNPVRRAVGAVAGIPGDVAKGVATGIMDQVTAWMVGAAQTISGWVVKEAGVMTSPDLNASWYLRLFSGLAALGGALAGLVGLIALASAAIRRDPDALGEVVYGVARAGIGTSIVIALTVIGLAAADAVANEFARQMPADFYKTLASQWGGSGFGGFGSAALAFLVAFVATIAGLLVWLELIVREAAIYIAVLFFPIGLAASIWPVLRSWVRRLSMLLLMFVLLRPVVVIVLALAGSVTASGLSFGSGSIPHSVGTILAGVVIFALAAFTPWSLMFLLGTEIGVMHSRGGTGTTGASGGSSGGSGGGGRMVAGGLGTAALAAGGGEPAMAGGGGVGAAGGGSGGMRLSSLGGGGSGGGETSGGSVAAAAGWVGGAAGAAGRIGGQLGQHAAARVHVAAGRSGVAPGGLLPPSVGGLDGGNSASSSRTADPEPPEPPSFSQGPSLAGDRMGSADSAGEPESPADAPSPLDSVVPSAPPSPPSALDTVGGVDGTPAPSPPPLPPPQSSRSGERPAPRPERRPGDGSRGRRR